MVRRRAGPVSHNTGWCWRDTGKVSYTDGGHRICTGVYIVKIREIKDYDLETDNIIWVYSILTGPELESETEMIAVSFHERYPGRGGSAKRRTLAAQAFRNDLERRGVDMTQVGVPPLPLGVEHAKIIEVP